MCTQELCLTTTDQCFKFIFKVQERREKVSQTIIMKNKYDGKMLCDKIELEFTCTVQVVQHWIDLDKVEIDQRTPSLCDIQRKSTVSRSDQSFTDHRN